MCREASRPATAARAATVLPAPHSPLITPIACSLMHHAIRATASRVRAMGVQHAGREVLAERHPGEPVMRAQPVDAHPRSPRRSSPSPSPSPSSSARLGLGEAGVVDALAAQLGVALGGQQAEVVDPGRRRRRRELALRPAVGVAADQQTAPRVPNGRRW